MFLASVLSHVEGAIKEVRYFIEDTSGGFRFGVELPDGGERGFEADGGHDMFERLYVVCETLFEELRAGRNANTEEFQK